VRAVTLALTIVCAYTTASAEAIKIPWKGDYAHNFDAIYSPENKYRSGMSKNFLNGAPEEGGKVQRDGQLVAEIMKPKGSTGPLPFVILMHGCTGWTRPVAVWAKEKAKIFLSRGYGVLILDSFAPRQVVKTCGSSNYHWGWRRAEDAYSALDYLIESKLANSDEIYAMGRSNGGTAVMMVSTAAYARGHRYKFAGLFAVSPSCAGLTKSTYVVPLLIFIGDKDQANDPKVCEEVGKVGDKVQVVMFKGVHHGYEDNTPAYTFNGWRMEYNAMADRGTIDSALTFMKSKELRPGVTAQ
jgi:dienelactone hydrolase